MIKDRIGNAGVYEFTSPLMKKAFEFLQSGKLDSMETGRYELQGDDLFVMVQENELTEWSGYRWETHRKYIDIQFVIKGRVTIGQLNIADMELDEPYDPARDVEFYKDREGGRQYLMAGDFAVFFPHDAHKPNILPLDAELNADPAAREKVRVAITKVRVDAL